MRFPPIYLFGRDCVSRDRCIERERFAFASSMLGVGYKLGPFVSSVSVCAQGASKSTPRDGIMQGAWAWLGASFVLLSTSRTSGPIKMFPAPKLYHMVLQGPPRLGLFKMALA